MARLQLDSSTKISSTVVGMLSLVAFVWNVAGMVKQKDMELQRLNEEKGAIILRLDKIEARLVDMENVLRQK